MSDIDVKLKVSAEDQATPEMQKLGVKMTEVSSAADKAAGSVKKQDDATKKASSSSGILSKALEKVKSGFAMDVVIGNLVTKGINMAVDGFKNLGKFALDCVYAFAESEMAVNRLDASLQNQGITSRWVTEDYKRFATEMQNLTGISDEAILKQLTLSTNFKLFGDEAKNAVKAAHAMSLGIEGMSFDSAMLALMKAAEGNTQALGRMGIKFEEAKDSGEQFQNILGAIQDKFGQLAEADSNNLITKTNALKELWGDFKEDVGALASEGGGAIDILTFGVNLLRDALKVAQNVFSAVFEEMVLKVERADLAVKYLVEGYYKAKDGILSLGKALGFVSEETIKQTAKEAKAAEDSRKFQEDKIALLEEQRTKIFDLERHTQQFSEAEQEAGKKQMALAQARAEQEKQLAEQAEKAVKAKEKSDAEAAKRAEDTAKRISDFKLKTEEELLNKVVELRAASNGLELAEAINKHKEEYESKINFLSEQLEAMRLTEEEEVVIKSEKYAQLQELESVYNQFKDEARALQQEKSSIFAEFDAWLTTSTTKKKKETLSDLAAFQNSNIKAVATAGKIAASATTMFTTYEMAVNSYNAMAGIPIVGPVLGAAAAAVAIAFGLEQVAKINGVQFALGTDYIPRDMSATVHQGEIIVPRTFADSLRAGDLALGSGDIFNQQSTATSSSQSSLIFNFYGNLIGTMPEEIIRQIQDEISENIATGKTSPFPKGELL